MTVSLFRFLWLALLVLFLSACGSGSGSDSPTELTDLQGKNISRLPMPPNAANTFSTAKNILYSQIYAGHEFTFYCDCPFDRREGIDLAACGVTPRKNPQRANRVEAEHVFPAHQFGNFRRCWREPVCTDSKGNAFKGRECCLETDDVFRMAHNDLHNLFPAVGEINGDRSNYNWGMLSGAKSEYGRCEIKIDSSIRRAEPPAKVRGDIARVYFYMAATYNFNLSRQDLQLFTAWHRQDPPDDWERERNLRIARVQGNENPFITGADYDPNGIVVGKASQNRPIPPSPVSLEHDDPPSPAAATVSTTDPAHCQTTAPTCSQLNSCESALFQLYRCGHSRLDGDGDGIPCTNLCRHYSNFSCETSKTCSQMQSCQEAKFHLIACNNRSLDRDGDGIPCQNLCN